VNLPAQTNPAERWSPTPEEGWVPVELGEYLVKPGSALDFSSLVEAGPAGKHGFLKVSPKGEFVFEKAPDKPVRIFSCSNPMEYWKPSTPEEIAAYAEQLRLAGYNCFRAHYLDLMLMIETSEDLQPNPKQLERWDILCAELKKRGIYLYVDITSIWFAYYGNMVRGKAWTAEGRKRNLYGRMYWQDPEARAQWEKATRYLLNRVNPQTGLALKDDPQVLVFGLRNEAGVHFLLDHMNKDGMQEKGLLPPFHTWLEQRYQNIANLNKAWQSNHASFADIPFPERKGVGPATADLQRFILDVEMETLDWMKGVVQSIGVRALIQDYNVGVSFSGSLAKSALPAVESHAYHDHPSSYISPGSTMTNYSAAAQGFPFVTWLNEVRQLDRPFIVTEWGYPYWNQWRYEAGLSAPAYGAFQGWQFLNHSHEAVYIAQEVTPRPFKIASDLPNRLGERMSTLLFARGDVTPSTRTVEVKLDPEGIFNRLGGEGYMPTALRRLTLLVRTGIRIVDFAPTLPGAKVEAQGTIKIHPTAKALVWADQPDQKETPSEPTMVESLRARGLLPPGNRTNVEQGIYQSDTGELTLDIKKRVMIVNTPRSQAAALPQEAAQVDLADVSIRNQGNAGCFFVSAIDAKPIKESRRLLILTVGDALNSGATFTNKSRQTLETLGTFPLLIKPVKAAITLHRALASGETAKLYALAFNGGRQGEVPIQSSPDGLLLALDSTALGNPVFQYELVIEPSR
jgi:hypothetical protein